jgi:4-alpha-glucanotransferase
MNGPELPRHVAFGRGICGTLAEAERREWWVSNGRGGYAAGTVAGSLTRRYHGLLVAALRPPLGRHLLFAKADATLVQGSREWPLFTNRWADGVLDPEGHVHLEAFALDGRLPLWRFSVGGLVLEQRIWLDPGKDIVYLAYRLVSTAGGDSATAIRSPAASELGPHLRIALLVNGRSHHHVTVPGSLDPGITAEGASLRVAHPTGLMFQIQVQGGTVAADRVWIENFDLPVERERGLEDRDSHLRAGWAHLTLEPGRWCGLAAGLGANFEPDLEAALDRVRDHDRALLVRARTYVPEMALAPAWIDQLLLAANAFLCTRPLANGDEGRTVIAGYPWFGDWGRDTMIALPGLTLATGQSGTARRILETYGRYVDHGMVPNLFPEETARPEYNSVDAALWHIEAWRAYAEATGDRDAVGAAFPTLASIIDAYAHGTRHGIHRDPTDGLIAAGEPGVQLTWMDAKVGDWVVTPRQGKPVEVNALWVNALAAMIELTRLTDRDPTPYEALLAAAEKGFRRFVRADGLGLYDVIDGPADNNGGNDARIRPNQILAVSLWHSPLSPGEQAEVVAVCGRELLCSFGVRSLAPSDPDYRGEYRGGVLERDGAYHQGPVWAWLLGHYAQAEYRVTGRIEQALSRLAPMAQHLLDAGLGTVSEIFDGEPPHRPRGAPAQAWSVACTLEAWWRLARLQGQSRER